MHIRRSPEEIAANRQRYEEHQKKGLEFAPKALPAPSTLPAAAIDAAAIIHQETIPGGWYWSTALKRGEALRIDQGEGGSTVALVAWNAADTSERLNLVDTVKVQWTTALGKGRVIFSDMGRVMFSLIEDSSGVHDCLMGGSTSASNAAKYPGVKTRNTRDNLVLVAKASLVLPGATFLGFSISSPRFASTTTVASTGAANSPTAATMPNCAPRWT